MSGFVRRFTSFPGTEVITEIEGVVIIDLPPPSPIAGVGTQRVACVVGEFADMRFAVEAAPATGIITTKAQPVEAFSSQDLLNKVGGFEETIGETGKAGGSGFIAIRNKSFSRLILVPINLVSGQGVRLYRQLPTNASAGPTSVVLLSAATVLAGREFKSGGDRVRVGTKIDFTALGAYVQGVDGDVTTGAPVVTQQFDSAGSSFLTAKDGNPVREGDLLVLGQIGGAGPLDANADTYRVTADAVLDTQLVVEKLDGSSFDWTTGEELPFRVHPSSDADSGGANAVGDAGAYGTPARPLDATIAVSTELTPTTDPPAPTQTTWDPLSGLKMRTDDTTALTFDATVQAPNAANNAAIDALYDLAIDSLLTEDLPGREVAILFSARHSPTIRSKLRSHVLTASERGVGRTCILSPQLDTQDTTSAIADTDPGVGGNRDERVDYAWPGAKTSVREAVGFAMGVADGTTTEDGILDVHLDGWLASLLSNLAPERNPGQSTAPVPAVMSGIQGFQRGVSGLDINDYKQYRAKGIAALRIDRTAGAIFQSGITTSLIAGQKNIARRRMADFIEDSLAAGLNGFSKQPLSDALKDSSVAEVDAFLSGLLSPNNPPAQRIAGYLIDDESGNTPELEAQGIFVIIAKVRTLASADVIVVQAEVGEAVNVTAT